MLPELLERLAVDLAYVIFGQTGLLHVDLRAMAAIERAAQRLLEAAFSELSVSLDLESSANPTLTSGACADDSRSKVVGST